MLMHAEKLVLGACLVATSMFVWTSMGGGENALTKSPSDLQREADKAQRYIQLDGWDELKPFRQGKSSAEDQIANATPVNASEFPLTIIGTPVATLAPRKDPEIYRPEQLNAYRFTAGIMIDSEYESPLAELVPAQKLLGGDGSGSSGRGSGSDRKDGSDRRGGDGSSAKNSLSENYQPLDRGAFFNDVNAKTIAGLRPSELGISSEGTLTRVFDVVCVTALVDFKKQSVAFEKAFAESIAYNAQRDRPIYQFLQVQRREITDQAAEWKDISENVAFKYQQPNPLTPMPLQEFGSAPEVVSPDNYDPVLTHSIPAFAMLDYQKFATHPALKNRREFPDWTPPSERRKLPVDGNGELDIFGQGSNPDPDKAGSGRKNDKDDLNSMRSGLVNTPYLEAITKQKPGGQYRLVRFFDIFVGNKRSSDFEYRVRVWVGDPNQIDPENGFAQHRGQQLTVDEGEIKFVGTGADMSEMMSKNERMEGKVNDRQDEDISVDSSDAVQKQMLSPAARKRIAAGTDIEMMQEKIIKAIQDNDPVEPIHVAEISDAGQIEQIKLPPSANRYAYSQYLRFARPSAWSEPVRVEKNLPSADVFAGSTVRKKIDKVESASETLEFEVAEPHFKVLVSYWNSVLHAKLPSERSAHIGETMNFKAPAYVTHPIDWTVLVAESPNGNGVERYNMPFETNETIVDAFFGTTQEFPGDKKQSIDTPTEILLMDANGNFKISNQFAHATNYRNEITIADDSRFYGKPKRPRKSKKDKADDDFGDFDAP